MTKKEYEQKLDAYKSSDAPLEVKCKAIEQLEQEFAALTHNKHKLILADIEASKADISDLADYGS